MDLINGLSETDLEYVVETLVLANTPNFIAKRFESYQPLAVKLGSLEFFKNEKFREPTDDPNYSQPFYPFLLSFGFYLSENSSAIRQMAQNKNTFFSAYLGILLNKIDLLKSTTPEYTVINVNSSLQPTTYLSSQ
jgi:hypothetical protein